MYCTRTVQIHSADAIYPYCDQMTKAANNLFNAALFRFRQVLTAVEKDSSKWTSNEVAVMQEIKDALPLMGSKYAMPTKGKQFLSYPFLNKLMYATQNQDFFNMYLPRQSAQWTLKEVVRTMKGFYASIREWNNSREKYKGKPSLPGYRHKGGNHTIVITNQDCVLHIEQDGSSWVKFPKTSLICKLGKLDHGTKLKQVTIAPYHDIFIISFVLEIVQKERQPVSEPHRICSIDFGVNNLAAITNNAGLPCLLFKGGVVKSINQYYNKRVAEIMSQQTIGTTTKFVPTPEFKRLAVQRDNRLSDVMHKVGKAIVSWCDANNIDTIVMGVNTGWKQRSNMSRQNNQAFVQIPFQKLKNIISYLAEREGISVIEQEESYTSKASFLDGDEIPSFGQAPEDIKFSGIRGPNKCRGLYKTKGGELINSDLNGSANIGRKAIANMYIDGVAPDFNNTIVILHPDLVRIQSLRQRQKAAYHGLSKSAAKRRARKVKK